MRNEDRILSNIRSDLLALGANKIDNGASRDTWLKVVAINLRALANLVEQDKLPDPFPIFRPLGVLLAADDDGD